MRTKLNILQTPAEAATDIELSQAIVNHKNDQNAHTIATITNNGFMSAADKVKLDGISGGGGGASGPDITGNAATATALQTARTINGVAFDGSADIVINAVDVTARVDSSLLGANNGVATLDATGKIRAVQLPSYVNNVVKGSDLASFPVTGETSKIYVALDTNKIYHWSGSSYVNITSGAVDSVAGKTGVVALAKGDVELSNVDNTSDINKPVSTAQAIAINAAQTAAIAASAPNTHIGTGAAAHALVTTSVAGFMSAADKVKLDGISSGGDGGSSGPDITGNAATATVLQNARTINGVTFDGSADIAINAIDSTARVASSLVGVANGIATLNASGQVPASQLPSFVDDVIEASDLAALPITGEAGKIYVTLDTNKAYRWSGTAYIYITSGTVDTVAGKTGIITLVKADVGLNNVDNTSDAGKPVSTAQATAISAAQATAIAASTPITHAGSTGTAHGAVTTTVNGFMSAADKVKLDAIAGTNTGDETAAGIRSKLGITTLTGSNTGDQTNITGNAATATVLQNARTINGVAFDGSADITINAVDSTSRVATSLLGANNGAATLDATGKVPVTQIPSSIFTSTVGALSGNTVIPNDDTEPLVTEGTEITRITIGPSNVNSKLLISGSISLAHGTNTRAMNLSCYRGSVCLGTINLYLNNKGRSYPLAFNFYDPEFGSLFGSTAVYSLRVGADGSGTWYVNRLQPTRYGLTMSKKRVVSYTEVN